MQAVYFFCTDPAKDRVVPAAFDTCRRVLAPAETSLCCDNMPVLGYDDWNGNAYWLCANQPGCYS